ncbi:MAG: aminotransferase [Leifsonia sp.]|nr:aminotransferase [Leifsonia sp.]|tara:strand:- start:129492 stop:130613 length:1122 start_codon:yes stop_codon:yes gene_type:complete
MNIDDYVARFDTEPGYLDFANLGPIGTAVQDELAAHLGLLSHARFGAFEALRALDVRMRDAVSALVGVPADQISDQPNTSQGLMHAMFGVTGGVALSPADYPGLTFAAQRAADALGVLTPRWIETDHGRITPGNLREQLDDSITAVALSLVDFRTGYLVDLEGIRQVIGDRLLIVDVMQGFGVVDAPYELADVVVGSGRTWVRAGWGTGFMVLSERALDQLTPVWTGYVPNGNTQEEPNEVPAPVRGARAFGLSDPDPLAQARLSAALEEIDRVGVAAIGAKVDEKVSRLIDLADEFAVPVVSPRAEHERAGIVVVEPEPEHLTVLAAALHNHGVSAAVGGGRVRLSAHATTNDETLAMLRSAFLSFSTATPG